MLVLESHSEASDQELEWEEQQIRKGVSIPAQPVSRLQCTLTDSDSCIAVVSMIPGSRHLVTME